MVRFCHILIRHRGRNQHIFFTSLRSVLVAIKEKLNVDVPKWNSSRVSTTRVCVCAPYASPPPRFEWKYHSSPSNTQVLQSTLMLWAKHWRSPQTENRYSEKYDPSLGLTSSSDYVNSMSLRYRFSSYRPLGSLGRVDSLLSLLTL